jgi:HK97 family phage major capsid protein
MHFKSDTTTGVLKELGQAFEEFKTASDQRIEEIENRLNRPGAAGNGKDAGLTEEEREHKSAFEAWVRNPKSSNVRANLESIQEKAVTTGTNAAGGYAVPEIINQQVIQQMREQSPLRRLARVVSVSSSDFKYPVDVGGTASGWVGEGDTRTETATPQLEEVAPTFGIVYAYPKASEEALADIQFDVSAWLTSRVAEELSIAEGSAFVVGNGTKKPTGFLSGTPEAIGDKETSPPRTFGELQYVPTGVADGFGSLSTASPEHYPADVFWETVYTLRAPYRASATWLMNSTTAGVIRRFKDADGNYLWRDGLVQGQPPLLCGYPVEIDDVAMPDPAANSFPVAFGDFNRGYLIADSFGLRMTMDDNITTPGQVRWYVRKRVGGKILDSDAIKLIKCAAS